ncbi:uncharacterised protein [Saccharolobus solfataricus]|uniref:Uncharacterized protein n=1 Tax=Saccharolobus solfataricus TaxID=2287 RepID=A0A157SZX4_SACSO|nr:uncharacterised protein [Saccharolobus solfataricus]
MRPSASLSLELDGELSLLQFGPEVGFEARIRVSIHGGPSCWNRYIKR